MNNDNNNDNDIKNIDLAYSYTEDFLKDRKSEIKQLDWRLGTFLGFAGLLLKFGIDLPNSQPSYLLTKIGALVTSFCSIAIVTWTLRSNPKGKIVKPSYLMKDECFHKQTVEIKAMIINTHTEASKELNLLANQKQIFFNRAIAWLAFSALFFVVNGILVSSFGK
jgi:hypothetical protein